MNDREFRNRLNQDLPDAPEIFHRAMTDTLKTIVREEGKRRAAFGAKAAAHAAHRGADYAVAGLGRRGRLSLEAV